MRFSRRLKSSHHCLPSPDGKFIAALFPSVIHARSVRSLEVVGVIKLPQDLAGPVSSFQWAPSSRHILVAVLDQIHIFSVVDASFHAVIRNALPPGAKPAYVGFGAVDAEVCVCSPFGLKFAVWDLASSKAVELASPKFFTTTTARKGFSFRPQTRHLALMTRSSGKDMISVHDPATRELQRSWRPETIDAQGLFWSPDGKWLVVWESAAHGHKILFYTPDGHVFKTWLGPQNPSPENRDYELGAGVRILQFSADASRLAVGDASRCLCIFDMKSVTEGLRLQHPSSIVPKDTLQVWQEQATTSHAGTSIHTFIRATQTIYPPARSTKDSSDAKSGCSTLLFDCSSALLATRLEEFPSTVWIWDILASELRAVLLFHANVTNVSWHPSLREILLVRCEGDQYSEAAFVWDPLWEGPRMVSPPRQAPGTSKNPGKSNFLWLNIDAPEPAVFFSDGKDFLLASILDSEGEMLPWQGPDSHQWDGAIREESPLELVPAAVGVELDIAEGEEVGDEDSSELDDTFHYKRDAGV